MAEQVIEVRAGKPRGARDIVEIDRLRGVVVHVPQRPADAIIPRTVVVHRTCAALAPCRKPVRHGKTKLQDLFRQIVMGIERIGHALHQISAETFDLVADWDTRLVEKAGGRATGEGPVRLRQPSGFDIEREKQGALLTSPMHIGMLLP